MADITYKFPEQGRVYLHNIPEDDPVWNSVDTETTYMEHLGKQIMVGRIFVCGLEIIIFGD